MAKIKILTRKPNWKEKKLISELEPIIEKRMFTDPDFAKNWRPVDSQEQLEALHSSLCTENAQIISETKTDTVNNLSSKNMETTTKSAASSEFVDPINRNEPIIRDYVKTGAMFDGAAEENTAAPQTNFGEPTSFTEAFVLPDTEDKDNVKGTSNKNEGQNTTTSTSGTTQSNSSPKENKTPKAEPVNPHFDEQSNASKRRKTRNMAKHIVKGVCFLLEKGFIWWTTKDINEAKLMADEVKGEIDLDLLVSLDHGQQVTVKDFFKQSCIAAAEAAKISEDDQKDLEDDLFDFLMEKGFAPTPTQGLAITTLQVVGTKLVAALMMAAQFKNVTVSVKEATAKMKEQAGTDFNDTADQMSNASNDSSQDDVNHNDGVTEYQNAEIVP